MTPREFKRIGRTRYGLRWKGKMAEALGVKKRVIQRWAKGEMVIPETVKIELVETPLQTAPQPAGRG